MVAVRPATPAHALVEASLQAAFQVGSPGRPSKPRRLRGRFAAIQGARG
ncbi:hypothetical protein [Sorangium sp. So ce1078]